MIGKPSVSQYEGVLIYFLWSVTDLFLLYLFLNSCSRYPLRKYYYIDLKMTWTAAQQYCRENYTDLATIESMDDINMLNPDFYYSSAWIGLRDNPESWKGTVSSNANSWRWSASGETSKTGYQAWNANEPNNVGGRETCTAMRTNGKWNDAQCETQLSFICYTGKKKICFIPTFQTWDSALKYCRQQHADLAMIEGSAENTQVFSVIPVDTLPIKQAWIGLYRLPWTWSDMSQSTFRNWLPRVPDNYGLNQFCAAENPKHYWDDKDCTADLNSCSHYPLRKYYYIDTKMSWTDAQQYCRENYTDLATIESMDDINMLKPDFYYSLAWIGLRDDPQSWMTAMGSDANSWRWSATGETSKTGYQIWDPSQPNNYHGDQTCVLMITNGKWNDMPCQGKQSFICYTGKKRSEFINSTN
uniref:C-type lectin domain-containing protein n=1 Tax=Lates calcarifer TaxID=8187 RepID=A0A4W6G4N5_LATCA